MKRILSGDLLIADVIVEIDGNRNILELIKRFSLKPGGKTTISEEDFTMVFSPAVEDLPVRIAPGGSAANTLWTLAKLLRDEVDISFLGVAGKGMSSNMIRKHMNEAEIHLLPETLPENKSYISPQTAVSYVFMFPDGTRTIATYPGNARQIITEDIITEDMIKNMDVTFLQGSLWQKFDCSIPSRILQLGQTHGKEFWLALPTNAWFAGQSRDFFQWIMPSATLILSNDDELGRIFNLHPKSAISRLQESFRDHKMDGVGNQVGFITMGEKGATVVTESDIHHIKPIEVEPLNTLGAGDTSYAGFLAARIAGLNNVQAGEVAIALASEKLKVNGPRLTDPRASLRQAIPALSDQIIPL